MGFAYVRSSLDLNDGAYYLSVLAEALRFHKRIRSKADVDISGGLQKALTPRCPPLPIPSVNPPNPSDATGP